MKVLCPAQFAYGHANYIYSDFGHYALPRDSDITYEIEVISCKHERWDPLAQVSFKAGEAASTAPSTVVAVTAKLSIKDE